MERCRLCYSHIGSELSRHIFDEKLEPPIWKTVKQLANLTIEQKDPYTKLVCWQCFDQLEKINTFQQMILETDYRIRHDNENSSENNSSNFNVYCSTIKSPMVNHILKEEPIEIEEHLLKIEYESNTNCYSSSEDSCNQQINTNSMIHDSAYIRLAKEMINESNANIHLDVYTNDNNSNEYLPCDIKEERNDDAIRHENEHLTESTIDNLSEIEEHPLKIAETVVSNLLPEKSKLRYEKEYNAFCKWRKSKNIKNVKEEVLLVYFSELSKKVMMSTLWSRYSMLRATISVKENINISKFAKLIALLKKLTAGYKPKKSNIFERHQIEKFLMEAPDKTYLFMKVVMVIGIAGGCRIDELYKITVDDIDDRGSFLIVNIPDTKTKRERTFTIIEKDHGVSSLEICKKYMSLRPSTINHRNFFICYRAEKCTVQRVGINTFYKVPRLIAQYLNLPNPELYTGHCFRRSSATLLVGTGADFCTFQKHERWKSNSGTVGCIEDSIANKIIVPKNEPHEGASVVENYTNTSYCGGI